MNKKTVWLLSAISMLLLTGAPALAQGLRLGSVPHVRDEILVRFKANTTTAARDRSHGRHGHRKLRNLGSNRFQHVKVAPGESVEAALASYANDPNIESVQPNFIYHVTAVPNDPSYGQQWGLKNTGQLITTAGGPNTPGATANPGVSGKDMNLQTAWNTHTNCNSSIVAVIDTGVNYNHQDLVANMWDGTLDDPLIIHHGRNFVGVDSDDPMDLNGHGTHVAGTIGAVGNNALGGTGVCWNAKIMALRVLDSTGSCSTADIVLAITFAILHSAKVINMSLAGPSFDSALDTSLTAAATAGIVVVVAAGNEGLNVDGATTSYPCSNTQANIICVAALTQAYTLASFSNFGTTSVDVGAPGANIVSTWPGTTSTLSDPLTAGWGTAAGWGFTTVNTGQIQNALADPPTFNYVTKYNNNADDRTFKDFNLTGVNVATLKFNAFFATESSVDFFKVNYKSAGGDPFTGGTNVLNTSGSTAFSAPAFAYDISPCISATCAVGFRLASNASTDDFGIAVLNFSIETLTLDATHYNVISGTSMAAPHVAGLAALVRSLNTSYTAADTIKAIQTSGVALPALSSKVSTGKAVDAWGAVSFIDTPSSISIVKQ